jgi:membrane protease subunit HflK
VQKVDVAFDRRVEIGFRDRASARDTGGDVAGESMMLTGDENISDIDFVVLWRISDAGKFLFQIRDPETTVKKVAESAMREIIARTPIQKALTEARGEVETDTKALMQKMLDEYNSGVVVNSVQLLKVDPPAQVVDAFDDVQRARADRERMRNEAETYRNDIVPRARGEAQKLLQDAEAYRLAVTSKAQGEAERFLSVYNAYSQAQDVTQRRMYLETMQEILKGTKKVIVGDKGAPILPYLPLDQLKAPATRAPAQAAPARP